MTVICRLVHAASSWNAIARSLLPSEGPQLDQSSRAAALQQDDAQDGDSLNGSEDYVPLVASGQPSIGSSGAAGSMSDLVAAAATWTAPDLASSFPPQRVHERVLQQPAATAGASHPHSTAAAAPQLPEAASVKAAAPPAGLGVKKVIIKVPSTVTAAATAVTNAGADAGADAGASAGDVSDAHGPSTPHPQRVLIPPHTPASAARVGGRSAVASVAWAPQTPGSGAVR
jgi:hypothetical protein